VANIAITLAGGLAAGLLGAAATRLIQSCGFSKATSSGSRTGG
jgi:hypothetical protein